MCEYILSGLIAGYVNVGPGKYRVQSIQDDGIAYECVIRIEPDEKMTEISEASFNATAGRIPPMGGSLGRVSSTN